MSAMVPDGFERVACKCPRYTGSDFWNDPHRWCGVDAPNVRFWMKREAADCERTVRPVAVKAIPIWANPYANYMGSMQNQLALQSQLNRPYGGFGPLGGLLGLGCLGGF